MATIQKDYSYQLIKMMAQCADCKPGQLSPDDNLSDDVIRKAIKFMLEQSLFFKPDHVNRRQEEMSNASSLPVRFSRTMKDRLIDSGKTFIDEKGKKLLIDQDGNRSVRDIIKKYTGHIVSQGKSSTIKFVNISHVWGQAYEANYFTSLWNIVLIPSYCNPLMDKVSGDLAGTVQSVFREVCNKLYDAKNKLASLSKDQELPNNPNDGIHVVNVTPRKDDSCSVTVKFDEKPDSLITAEIHFIGDYGEAAGEVESIAEDIEIYSMEDVKAYKTLLNVKQNSKKSYISYLNGVLLVLKNDELLKSVKRKPRTIRNWKAAIGAAKKLIQGSLDEKDS